MTDDEIVANVIAFVVAGTDTTAIRITHAIQLLLEEPAQVVRTDRGLIGAAIEETLRLFSPARCGICVVTRDCELGGVALPQAG